MKFAVGPKIFERWPNVAIGVLVLRGINNGAEKGAITRLLRQAEAKAKTDFETVGLARMPEVVVWRDIYEQFGSNPKDFRSSVEAIMRRAGNGRPLPVINPLVDLGNYLSLQYHLPSGVENIDKVVGDIELTFAQGTESGIYLGSETPETCYPGEVIYKDNEGFICRRWNWREGKRTAVEKETTNAVLVLEAMPPTTQETLKGALEEAENLVVEYLGGKVEKFILSENVVQVETGSSSGVSARPRLAEQRARRGLMKIPVEKTMLSKQLVGMAKELQEIVHSAAKEYAPDLKLDEVKIEHPAQESFGDYSSNVAMVIFSKVESKDGKVEREFEKFRGPRELAEAIAEQLRKEPAFAKSFGEATVAGGGFINIWLQIDYLSSLLKGVVKEGAKFGRSDVPKGKRIVVEYAHPNTHKELHIGHMRTLITGEALARIFEATGVKVFRANYQGDIGPHVAKAIWGTEKLLKERDLTWEVAEKLDLRAKAHLLGEGYVRGNQDSGKFQTEIDDLNTRLYQKDKSVWPVYERTRKWSLDYYDSFYRRFYAKFDQLRFESEVAQPGKEIVLKNLGRVFEESEGAIIFNGEKYGLHKRVFITQDGNPTYEAKDMGLAPLQFKDFPFDLIIHVVANEQADYFKVIIKALELIDPKFRGREYHLPMGMVNLVGAKMSSRTGAVLTVDDLLDHIKELLKPLVGRERLKDSEIEEILEACTIGAVKYSVLKTGPTLNVAFDPTRSVSLDGNSGPYLQYTFARTQSVLRKSEIPASPAGGRNSKSESFEFRASSFEFNPEELSVLRWLYRFPEVVAEAAQLYAPNLICSYLFDLAQRFNLFYQKHRILNPKSEARNPKHEIETERFRLALTAAVGQVLKNGLELLGIEAPERM